MKLGFLNKLNPANWRGLLDEARLVWHLARDRRVPILAKLVPLAVLAYIVSPLDVIPAIPILGQMDDLAVLMLGINTFLKMVPSEVVAEHRTRLGIFARK